MSVILQAAPQDCVDTGFKSYPTHVLCHDCLDVYTEEMIHWFNVGPRLAGGVASWSQFGALVCELLPIIAQGSSMGPIPQIHWPILGSMLIHLLRHCPNIDPATGQCLVLTGMPSNKLTDNSSKKGHIKEYIFLLNSLVILNHLFTRQIFTVQSPHWKGYKNDNGRRPIAYLRSNEAEKAN